MHGLHELWRKRRGTTPYVILCEAIELLRLTPSGTGRSPDPFICMFIDLFNRTLGRALVEISGGLFSFG
ncbi:hypothetical protein XH80_00225 [Bradyrhizobium sp. CCBAU 45384]|nr:hypothetical protein [Bradyrhizobium sp. CCBAU 45384]